ncbi:lactococcin 972 family bacteriocin [Mycetocola lacteus]|uniref:lactococcin 972 family bacteriocin n=1 Tax=Mycetocola lacteus TaxID=76637 RepID=UPI0016011575|nr:lactococcin 972 family bacteriocin [Mycetocola lacteus]
MITTKKGIAMKKLLRNGIITGSLVTGLLLTGGALAPGAFAAGTSTPDGGGNSTQSNDKPLKIEHPGGGTWNWGVLLGDNWSYYLHGSKVHSAAVEGDNGIERSGWQASGKWAKANAPDSDIFRTDGAWWDVR